MSILTIYKGRKGKEGTNGLVGLGVSDVSSSMIDNPVLDCLQPNALSKNAYLTWERDGLAVYQDRYNINRFSEAESYTNYVDYSEDFTQWNDPFNIWSIIGSTSDPFGGNDATEINLDTDTDNLAGTAPVIQRNENGWPLGGYVVVSFYIKLISGDVSSLDVTFGSSKYKVGQISSSYERKFLKVSASSGGFLLGINPRGKAGARIALTAVQIENTVLNPYVRTSGSIRTITYESTKIERENNKGYLVEDQKQNKCLNTQDFESWSIEGGSILEYAPVDSFGFPSSKISLVFNSLPTISLTTPTETIIEGNEYTVSFYAYVSGGSLNDITVSLGGGLGVVFAQPSVIGFSRVSAVVIAGPDDELNIAATSEALNASLHMQCFQVEEGKLSTYTEGSTVGQTRSLDLISMRYNYNSVAPSLPWTFICEQQGMPDDSRVKTIFSNGESGPNEFSLTLINRIHTLNNGGNIVEFSLFDYRKIAVTYDGVSISFYGEKRILYTAPNASTSFIASDMYIGSNGIGESFNAYLSKVMFYNKALPPNDISYLLGV